MPDKPELAETYYSQFEDEFERTEEVDGEAGQTLVANSNLGEEEDEEEIEDLMNCMQNALDKSDTGEVLHLHVCVFCLMLMEF